MKHIVTAAFALLVPFVIGCSGDSDVTVPPGERISLAPQVNSATINAGGSATVIVTVTRPVGYSGPVALTAENFPSGVTGTFAPTTLASDENTSTLTLSATAGAPSGSATVTLRASGTDVQSESATINVVVGTAVPGSFTLLVTPATLSVNRGGSTTATVAIDRLGGYSGAVAVTISGFPNGIFATVTPPTISAGNAIINIQLDNSVAGGSYTATVTAVGEGAPPQNATLTLQVLPAIRY